MRFRTTILTAGKTATGIEVPPEVVEALGASKRLRVATPVTFMTHLALTEGDTEWCEHLTDAEYPTSDQITENH